MFPLCFITMSPCPTPNALLIGWLRRCEQAVEIYTIKPVWKTWEFLHVFTGAINAGISAYRFTICCRKFITSHLRKHHFFGWKSCPVVRGVWVSRSGNKKIFVKPDLPGFLHLWSRGSICLPDIGNHTWEYLATARSRKIPIIEMLQDCFRQRQVLP